MYQGIYPSYRRLVPRQSVIALVIISTSLQTGMAQASSSDVSDGNSLSASWIVAIVVLILLTCSVAMNVWLCWRQRHSRLRDRSNYRARVAESVYYDISRPARTYSRRNRLRGW